jgi:hypothetical protein
VQDLNETIVWTGGGGNANWNNPNNWNPHQVPTGSTIASFNATTPVHLNLSADAVIAGLYVTSGTEVDVTGAHILNIVGTLVNDGDIELSPGVTLEVNGVVQNSGHLTIDDPWSGATLLIDDHVKLEGGGFVTLDGVNDRITGTFSSSHTSTLENVDNVINGYGKLGDGHLNLINDQYGTIAATNSHEELVIDTGFGSFINHGLVVSDKSGGLEIKHSVFNDGTLEAHAGRLEIDGNVTGHGIAKISGGTLEFGGDSDAAVEFVAGTHGTLILDDPDDFTGTISGYATGDSIRIGNNAPTSVTSAGDAHSLDFHFAHGPDLIIANSNNTAITHTLVGDRGDDIFIGSSGSDNFVFADDLGDDIITNFQHGTDHIDLHTMVSTNNLNAWIDQHVTQSRSDPADTLITIDGHDTITLHNVLATSLTAGDFIVHPGPH